MLIFLLLLLPLSSALPALGAPDPLRPPQSYLEAVSAPVEASAAPRPELELQSVLISAERRLAIINGIRLHEGAGIEGAEVLRIFPGGVELRWQEESWLLKVNAGAPRKRFEPAAQTED